MTKVEKNNNTASVEEEFSRLGFDYKKMKEKALYLGNSYAILNEIFKINTNSDLHYHDELHVQFGVNCKNKRELSSLSDMSTRLIRYTSNCYEGIELDSQFYNKEFPSKDQIFSEAQRILEKPEIIARFNIADTHDKRINQAKEVLTMVNSVEPGKPNSLKRKR